MATWALALSAPSVSVTATRTRASMYIVRIMRVVARIFMGASAVRRVGRRDVMSLERKLSSDRHRASLISLERSPAVDRVRVRDRHPNPRQEAALMTLVGCDLHTRKQQVAVLDTTTGEVVEQELVHEGDAVERFYRALRPPVTIGIETTGYTQWFHALMHRLGHTVLVGEAAKIRAMVVRKTKTDRRDARHLLELLKHDRFPTVWIPDPDTRDLRALVAHRVRFVRMRTAVKNGLQAIALS